LEEKMNFKDKYFTTGLLGVGVGIVGLAFGKKTALRISEITEIPVENLIR
jgi:hypothetical protein